MHLQIRSAAFVMLAVFGLAIWPGETTPPVQSEAQSSGCPASCTCGCQDGFPCQCSPVLPEVDIPITCGKD